MRQLDLKKDGISFPFILLELQNTNNRLAKQYFTSMDKKRLRFPSSPQQQQDISCGGAGVIEQIRTNYDQIGRWSAEKLGLARKVYAYVEANLAKVRNKMREMEDNNQINEGGNNNQGGRKRYEE